MAKRRHFPVELKARVALEALSGAYTMADLSTKHGVHPNMIVQWKKNAQDGLSDMSPGKANARKMIGKWR